MRSIDRILTTHVGSLIRPPELIPFLKAREEGKPYDEKAFAACLKDSIEEVVRQQSAVGIDIVSDGEFGKSMSWSRYILDRLSGFEQRPRPIKDNLEEGEVISTGNDRRQFADFYAEYDKTQGFSGALDVWVCTAPIKYTGEDLLQRDIATLKQAVAKVDVAAGFLPVVAPASVIPDRSDEHYASERDYVFGIAEALREEYRTIVESGLMAQIDDAHLPFMYDRMVPPKTLKDFRNWAEIRIDALNHAIEGLPADRIRYHICWGSWNGPHVGDVELEDIVDMVHRVNAGAYCIEMANPRHEHEWRVWEKVKLPKDKVLVPGVIAHTTNVVEHPKLVADRLVRLAKLVGRESVMGGTDCGFAQGPFVRRVHPTIMWAKLRALAEGAALASNELWGRRVG